MSENRVPIFRRELQESGPWDQALAAMERWDPVWTGLALEATTNPWNGGTLNRRTIELVSIAAGAAWTNFDKSATRRHIRAALDAGATPTQIFAVLKLAALMAISACTFAAAGLVEQAARSGTQPHGNSRESTPACNRVREMGHWNEAWDPMLALDPKWMEQFGATLLNIYESGVLPPVTLELISVALTAPYTHAPVPPAQGHVNAALRLGAGVEEIFEVLKLCAVQGTQSCNLGVPILAEELDRTTPRYS